MEKTSLSRKRKYDDNIKMHNDMRHEEVNYPESNATSLLCWLQRIFVLR
jgi:hypothetical protein